MSEILLASVLVVTSKIKKHIKDNFGFSTSNSAIQQLSKAVEAMCKRGVDNAKTQKRKTVMDRDIFIDHL